MFTFAPQKSVITNSSIKMNTGYAQSDVYQTNEHTLVRNSREGMLKLDDEVIFIKNLHEIPVMANQAVRIGYNAVVHCLRGRIEMEIGGALSTEGALAQRQKIKAQAGELLLLPANKLMQPMMVSTDVEVAILLVSDKVLREVLGPQINLWNRAMFLDEIYVIDGGLWSKGADSYARTFFQDINGDKKFKLFRELVLSFLRTLFLMICEMLMRQNVSAESSAPHPTASTSGEKSIFDRFMLLLSQEQKKRQRVSYYASKLNITPKYLSTVCREVSGKSPIRWITESVMEDIYQLLHNTDMSIKEISNKLGFPNSSFFGQYFKEEAGITPLEYRNKSRQLG